MFDKAQTLLNLRNDKYAFFIHIIHIYMYIHVNINFVTQNNSKKIMEHFNFNLTLK